MIARLGEITPSAPCKSPATARSPFGRTANADTPPMKQPLPTGDQFVPVSRARPFTKAPPAVENQPPASRSPLGRLVIASTSALVPEPSADHVAPFQLAMWLAGAPPALVKPPPTTRSPFAQTCSAVTKSLN